MADPFDVLTLAEAKSALRIGATDVSIDDRLGLAITNVSRQIDRFIGPVIQRTVTAELHDGATDSAICNTVWTRLMPVTSITTVTEYRAGVPTVLVAETLGSLVDGYLAEPYDYDAALLSGEIIRRNAAGRTKPFASGRRNIAVTYIAGRVTTVTAVDPGYKEAALIVLRNLWRSDEQSIGAVGEYTTPASNFPADGIPSAVRDLLGDEWQQRPGFA